MREKIKEALIVGAATAMGCYVAQKIVNFIESKAMPAGKKECCCSEAKHENVSDERADIPEDYFEDECTGGMRSWKV